MSAEERSTEENLPTDGTSPVPNSMTVPRDVKLLPLAVAKKKDNIPSPERKSGGLLHRRAAEVYAQVVQQVVFL